eukprot:scaffold3788_cov158-Ochromonas_danica.AAC.4
MDGVSFKGKGEPWTNKIRFADSNVVVVFDWKENMAPTCSTTVEQTRLKHGGERKSDGVRLSDKASNE